MIVTLNDSDIIDNSDIIVQGGEFVLHPAAVLRGSAAGARGLP